MFQSPKLEEILAAFEEMTPEEKQETIKVAMEETGHLPWVPSPGGQTEALHSAADELFTGGEPGGGKSSLLVGTAVTQHMNSIIFRREYPQIKGLEKEATRILGSRTGYNSQDHIWRIPGTKRVLEFGSVPHEWSVEKYQGRDHDFKGFDEITHFSRTQYQYLTLWLRSAIPGQRCRIISTGNPPQTADGLWVIQHWAPWLDENYHDPAEPGELRWAVPADDESDVELFLRSPEEAMDHIARMKSPPRDAKGELLPPRSRTFIPAKMEDIPELADSGYGAVLAYAPGQLKNLASGKFTASLQDDPHQVIPTEWITAAQERWKPDGYQKFLMTAMALDPAGGGQDAEELIWRHGGWFAEPVTTKGPQTKDGSRAAGLVVTHRRADAPVIVDVGGGYGGAVTLRLDDNGIPHHGFNGARETQAKTKDGKLGFYNRRAEILWRLREELDPDQEGGSVIALPPNAEVRSDLAAPRWKLTAKGILVESKIDIRKRLGRSTGKGDAIAMCLVEGQAVITRELHKASRHARRAPKVVTAQTRQRDRRRRA